MIGLLCLFLALVVAPFKSQSRLEAENSAFRHQLIVLRRKVHGRVRLTNNNRWCFIQRYRWFPPILKVLKIIRPEMLVRWHRARPKRLRIPSTVTTIRARLSLLCALVALVALFAPVVEPAFAAGEVSKGPSELLFVAQIVLLMLIGRLLGEVMLRFKQPAVMGQLIAGLVLGPSVLGALFPDWQHALFPTAKEQKAMIDAISQFGVLLLLLLTGMETDLKLVKKTGLASGAASLAGILVPFACGVALGEMLPDSMIPDPGKRLITSLFLGTALSIASVKIVATVIAEMNFTRRTVGQVILASAIIDDTIGWIITAIIFSLALQGQVDAFSIAKSVLGTLVFMGLSLTMGRRVVFSIIRWVNDNFESDFAVITAILLITCVMAIITDLIGVHTVLGAFVAGILIGQSPILTRHIDEQLRGLIFAFFMPVFFGTAGLSADLTILKDPALLALTFGLIVVASVGKFSGAFIGGKLGGLTPRESLALGTGMNARGSTEVIIATIGLSMGALNQNLFTMIVIMAVITTVAMPPTLRWALARLPMRKEEKQRLDREDMEAKGFVPKLERLLLAIDESTNGKFATRIAGIIASSNAMPTTVMHIETEKKTGKVAANAEKERAKEAGKMVKEVAKRAELANASEEKTGTKLHVTTMVEKSPEKEAVAEEAKKGYDLMIIGMEKTAVRRDQFHDDVTSLAAGFEGPIVVADARQEHLEHPMHGKLSILVPVNGTEPSRRAAEIAITLARASKAPLTALYAAAGAKKKRSRQYEEAILKDIVELAETYEVDLRTSVRANVAPDEAILKEMARRRHNLVVMGVGRRPGEKLFFGDTAAALLEKSEHTLLFVAS
jgi:Kef-type K+ transport system membrane component KefB/nucleotide-binding universal stress UspA family protein